MCIFHWIILHVICIESIYSRLIVLESKQKTTSGNLTHHKPFAVVVLIGVVLRCVEVVTAYGLCGAVPVDGSIMDGRISRWERAQAGARPDDDCSYCRVCMMHRILWPLLLAAARSMCTRCYHLYLCHTCVAVYECYYNCRGSYCKTRRGDKHNRAWRSSPARKHSAGGGSSRAEQTSSCKEKLREIRSLLRLTIFPTFQIISHFKNVVESNHFKIWSKL